MQIRKIISITLFAIVLVVEMVVYRERAAHVPQDGLWFLGIGGCVIYGAFGVAIGCGHSPFPKPLECLLLRPITGLDGREFFIYLLPTVMLSMGVPYLILGGPLLALGICQFSVAVTYCLGLGVGTLARSRG